MKGLIIIGYQGIGKSSIGGKKGCIDLESSNFYINGDRNEDWYKIYCEIALDLANQGYTVLISSHRVIRNYFLQSLNVLPDNIGNIVVFCPRLTQKNEWIKRLQDRYDKTKKDKDHRALMRAVENFDTDIRDLIHSGFYCYNPESIDYNLLDYIFKIQYDWCMSLDN